MDLRLATLKQSLSICCTMFQHWINAERFPVSHLCVNTLPHLCVNTLPASWQSVYTQMWHRKPLCIDSVLKHCAANRKILFQLCQTWVHIFTTLAFLALLGATYIYIYIYDISSLRVNLHASSKALFRKSIYVTVCKAIFCRCKKEQIKGMFARSRTSYNTKIPRTSFVSQSALSALGKDKFRRRQYWGAAALLQQMALSLQYL